MEYVEQVATSYGLDLRPMEVCDHYDRREDEATKVSFFGREV